MAAQGQVRVLVQVLVPAPVQAQMQKLTPTSMEPTPALEVMQAAISSTLDPHAGTY